MAWAHAAFRWIAYDGYLQLNALPQLPSSTTAYPLGVDLLQPGDDEGSSRLLRGIDERLPSRSGFARLPRPNSVDLGRQEGGTRPHRTGHPR
jgi:hypothetical protein